MIRPIVDRRTLSRQGLELALQKSPERRAGNIDIGTIAINEIHRNIERVIYIALVSHSRLEHEGQHAGAVGIRVTPHLATHRLEAVWLALGER